jgi:hypothetical protein
MTVYASFENANECKTNILNGLEDLKKEINDLQCNMFVKNEEFINSLLVILRNIEFKIQRLRPIDSYDFLRWFQDDLKILTDTTKFSALSRINDLPPFLLHLEKLHHRDMKKTLSSSWIKHAYIDEVTDADANFIANNLPTNKHTKKLGLQWNKNTKQTSTCTKQSSFFNVLDSIQNKTTIEELKMLDCMNMKVPEESEVEDPYLNSNTTVQTLYFSRVHPSIIKRLSYNLTSFKNLDQLHLTNEKDTIFSCEDIKYIINSMKNHINLIRIVIGDINIDGCYKTLAGFITLVTTPIDTKVDILQQRRTNKDNLFELYGTTNNEYEYRTFISSMEDTIYNLCRIDIERPSCPDISIELKSGEMSYKLRLTTNDAKTKFIKRYEQETLPNFIKKKLSQNIEFHKEKKDPKVIRLKWY